MEIYVAYVPFENGGGKLRPVLVFRCGAQIVEVFNITTQYAAKSEKIRANYYPIVDWCLSGLDKQSYVDTNVVRDLPIAAISGKSPIGHLTEADKLGLAEFLTKQEG